MPMHSNFESRTVPDVDAALAAVMSVLRTLIENSDFDTERARHLMTHITGDDVNLRARSQWLIEWMAGYRNTDGSEA